jgi:hypothetical protein
VTRSFGARSQCRNWDLESDFRRFPYRALRCWGLRAFGLWSDEFQDWRVCAWYRTAAAGCPFYLQLSGDAPCGRTFRNLAFLALAGARNSVGIAPDSARTQSPVNKRPPFKKGRKATFTVIREIFVSVNEPVDRATIHERLWPDESKPRDLLMSRSSVRTVFPFLEVEQPARLSAKGVSLKAPLRNHHGIPRQVVEVH